MFQSGDRGLLKHLGVEGPLRRLDPDLPSARERRLDFLAQLQPDHLLHIEFHTTKNTRFVLRMLGYHSEILERCGAGPRSGRSPRPLAIEIRQILLYLGQDRWTHPARLDHANLTFRFEIVNVIDLLAKPLIESGDVGDAIFAVLCRDGTSSAVIRAILSRIAEAPHDQRADALAQLLVIADLRKASARIVQVQAEMPITVNVANIPLLRESIDRAFAEGQAAGLVKGEARGEARGEVKGLAEGLTLVLAGIFGPLPEDLTPRLMTLRPKDLILMISRVHAAFSLEAVSGDGLRRRRKGKS